MTATPNTTGGRFEFDDGGSYAGTWQEGMSHGHGVCSGPRNHGEYAGAWNQGFETSGVYKWTNGNYYEGQWLQGRRHGLGVEKKGNWLYRGEWTQGYKGRYGIRQSISSGTMFEGTWTSGMQDGYGVETYADGGTYQGQWMRGVRHGYGIRMSVSYDLAVRYRRSASPATSLGPASTLNLPGVDKDQELMLRDRDRRLEENRGGFVLLAGTTLSEEAMASRRIMLDKHGKPSLKKTIVKELKLIRQRSTGDLLDTSRSNSRQSGGSVRSTTSSASQSSGASTSLSIYSCLDDDGGCGESFVSQPDLSLQENVIERYYGEWKNDKRCGYGVCDRSDGVRYEGEWLNNKKNGYGVTTLRDGSRIEGKYKSNILVSHGKNSKLFLLRSSKLRDRVEAAVLSAHKAADISKQKSEIAIARMTSARVKAEQAQEAARLASSDAEIARSKAKQFSPSSSQPGANITTNRLQEEELQCEIANVAMNANHTFQVPPGSASTAGGAGSGRFSSLFRSGRKSSMEEASNARLDAGGNAQYDQLFNDQQKYDRNGTVHSTGTSRRFHSANPQTSTYRNFSQSFDEDLTPNDIRSPRMNEFNQFAPETHTSISPQFAQFNPSPSPDIRQNSPWNSPPITQDTSWQDARSSNTLGHSPGGFGRPALQNSSNYTSSLAQPGYRPYDDVYANLDHQEFSRERRKSLPSIIKQKPSNVSTSASTASKTNTSIIITTAGRQTPGNPHTTVRQPSKTNPSRDVNRYVIEEGIRKRVRSIHEEGLNPRHVSALSRPLPQGGGGSPDEDEEKDLPTKYTLEDYKKSDMGSVPDISTASKQYLEVMPREVAYVMSQQRREELMKERKAEERRNKNQIVLRFGDLVEFCERRTFVALIILLNIGLAALFFNMLY